MNTIVYPAFFQPCDVTNPNICFATGCDKHHEQFGWKSFSVCDKTYCNCFRIHYDEIVTNEDNSHFFQLDNIDAP